jgi:hypothetical protein
MLLSRHTQPYKSNIDHVVRARSVYDPTFVFGIACLIPIPRKSSISVLCYGESRCFHRGEVVKFRNTEILSRITLHLESTLLLYRSKKEKDYTMHQYLNNPILIIIGAYPLLVPHEHSIATVCYRTTRYFRNEGILRAQDAVVSSRLTSYYRVTTRSCSGKERDILLQQLV